MSRHERKPDHRRTHARRRGPDSFRCRRCRLDVPMAAPGTQHRNHCPNCLWSRHVDDDVPGDRSADCAGSMEPIGVSVRDDGGDSWTELDERIGGVTALAVSDTVR